MFFLSCNRLEPTATLLLQDGRVYTNPAEPPRNLDILITGSTISRVGSDLEAPPGCRVLSLHGATVFPGFVDAHAHPAGLGKAMSQLDLRGVPSLEDLVERTRRYAQTIDTDHWVVGRGWDQNLWKNPEMPDNRLLSEEITDLPVFLERVDGHAALVNQKALHLAGIDADTPSPDGGEILKDQQGIPTGILIDRAQELVEMLIPPPTIEDRMDHLRKAMDFYASLGVTSVHDAGVDEVILDAYFALAREGKMKVFSNLMLDDNPKLLDSWFQRGPYEDRWLRIKTIKLYADGALGSRGAWLHESYKDRPGYMGLMVTPLEHIRTVCEMASRHNFQVATHCIGDRAVDEVITIYADSIKEMDPNPRWRIEHAQVITPEALPVFQRWMIYASMQPYHYVSDRPWAPDRIGDRMDYAYAWNLFLENQIPLCFGSDAPVESPDPLQGFEASLEGPHRISAAQALCAYTLTAQSAGRQERLRGRIESGASADISVFDHDFVSDPATVSVARCRLTLANGTITHGGEW